MHRDFYVCFMYVRTHLGRLVNAILHIQRRTGREAGTAGYGQRRRRYRQGSLEQVRAVPWGFSGTDSLRHPPFAVYSLISALTLPYPV